MAMKPCISFWVVGRLPEGKDKNKVFNMGLTNKVFCVVTVGHIRGDSVAMTTEVTVPMMTNTKSVKAGDELLIEIAASNPKGKRKAESWKDDVARAAKAKAKPMKSPGKKGSGDLLDVGHEV